MINKYIQLDAHTQHHVLLLHGSKASSVELVHNVKEVHLRIVQQPWSMSDCNMMKLPARNNVNPYKMDRPHESMLEHLENNLDIVTKVSQNHARAAFN